MSEISEYSFSNDRYDGSISNTEILTLLDECNAAYENIRKLEHRISEIQKNCKHEYYFSGFFYFCEQYVCRHCGHNKLK